MIGLQSNPFAPELSPARERAIARDMQDQETIAEATRQIEAIVAATEAKLNFAPSIRMGTGGYYTIDKLEQERRESRASDVQQWFWSMERDEA